MSDRTAKTFLERYRFFRDRAGYIVGESAKCAFELAKAEEAGERRGLVFWLLDEECPWDGDCDPPAACYVCLVYRGEECTNDGEPPYQGFYPIPRPIASLGMVGVDGPHDSYLRVVKAELFQEALDVLDKEDQDAADALSERPTFAAVRMAS
jgi:hypothetical protein